MKGDVRITIGGDASLLWRDWSHACEACGWASWRPPEVNAEGHHLSPEGDACAGRIICSPPPTRDA